MQLDGTTNLGLSWICSQRTSHLHFSWGARDGENTWTILTATPFQLLDASFIWKILYLTYKIPCHFDQLAPKCLVFDRSVLKLEVTLMCSAQWTSYKSIIHHLHCKLAFGDEWFKRGGGRPLLACMFPNVATPDSFTMARISIAMFCIVKSM